MKMRHTVPELDKETLVRIEPNVIEQLGVNDSHNTP
jgi:hypothetical protein